MTAVIGSGPATFYFYDTGPRNTRAGAEYAAWASAGVTNVENELTIEEPALVF